MAITTVDNIVLQQDPRLEITGGPSFSTTITRTKSGYRAANINWNIPLWQYQIKYIEQAANFQDIIAFWIARRGPGYAFLIKDPMDYSDGGAGQVKLIGSTYQMVKEYPDALRPYYRNISRPVSGTVTLSGVSGTPVIDYTTGIVSGATSEGTWVGDFMVPVAFMKDTMDYSFKPSSNEGYLEWTVPIEEVRVVS